MDHDSYWLLSRFWWLIFPLFWMIFAALAFSNFLSLLLMPRGWPPRDLPHDKDGR